MRRVRVLIVVLGWMATAIWSAESVGAPADEPWDPDRPWEVIDLAIVLDTSGSMESLIDATRFALWELLEDAAQLEPTPMLRIALVSYGNSDYSAGTGRVRIDTDFTQDFDRLSERLFSLTTGKGGAEYVARAVKVALEGLTWTSSEEALQLILIAGNESAEQDPQVSLEQIGQAASERGVFVHAVFWGNEEEPRAETWKQLGVLAEGRFDAVDPLRGARPIETPLDEELVALNLEFNETLLPIGEKGRSRQALLIEQDGKIRALGSAAVASRVEIKTSHLYLSGWDLIDAIDSGRVALHELTQEELPEPLQGLSFDQQELYIEEMRSLREEISLEIAEIVKQRREYVAEQIVTPGLQETASFGAVVRRMMGEKVEEQGFVYPEP